MPTHTHKHVNRPKCKSNMRFDAIRLSCLSIYRSRETASNTDARQVVDGTNARYVWVENLHGNSADHRMDAFRSNVVPKFSLIRSGRPQTRFVRQA